jgi:hypothetical protein
VDIEKIRIAAEQGRVTAQTLLGLQFLEGGSADKLGTVDYQQAYRWLSAAAEQGSPRAQVNLGVMYQQGLGRSRDINRALYWFEKAKEKGDVLAYMLLARHFSEIKQFEQACSYYTDVLRLGEHVEGVNQKEAREYLAENLMRKSADDRQV